MTKTPIYDFAKSYAKSGVSRFHMPGHKGKSYLGIESFDITEIEGADVLGCANGVILESEDIATSIFGTAHTFYSTEGSSLSIKAMLAIATARHQKRPLVLAARNAHKSFIYACALLDLEVSWLYGNNPYLCGCNVHPTEVERAINNSNKTPSAIYITSPDYLGNLSDIAGIAKVCKKYGIPLLVDNAHGAYLNFTEPSIHPIALGADMCCDSAHKTLPVLTGGAYLHISKETPENYLQDARSKLSLFASTSPSYLILESLDICNKYLANGYAEKLAECIYDINAKKTELRALGFSVAESEPLKIVIQTTDYGYTGVDIAAHVRKFKVEPEFSDSEHIVFMATPDNAKEDFERLTNALKALKRLPPLNTQSSTEFYKPEQCMTIREAVFAHHEIIPVSTAEGRICGAPTVSCPPAVPISVSGERIPSNAVKLFLRYGINEIEVVKE